MVAHPRIDTHRRQNRATTSPDFIAPKDAGRAEAPYAMVPRCAVDDAALGSAALRLLIAMCGAMDAQTWGVVKKISTFARELGVSRQKVYIARDELIALGYIVLSDAVPKPQGWGPGKLKGFIVQRDITLPTERSIKAGATRTQKGGAGKAAARDY